MNASPFKVSGNWDQIQRFAGLRALCWQPENPKLPNRVSLACYSLDEGQYIVEMMKTQNLVVFKNWLT